MSEIKKSVIGSVRLDSDVWKAVRAMECSLNQYLRSNLLGEMRLAGPKVKGTVKVEDKSATVNVVSGGFDPATIPGVRQGLPPRETGSERAARERRERQERARALDKSGGDRDDIDRGDEYVSN